MAVACGRGSGWRVGLISSGCCESGLSCSLIGWPLACLCRYLRAPLRMLATGRRKAVFARGLSFVSGVECLERIAEHCRDSLQSSLHGGGFDARGAP